MGISSPGPTALQGRKKKKPITAQAARSRRAARCGHPACRRMDRLGAPCPLPPRTRNPPGCTAGPRAGQGIPLPAARGLPAARRGAAPALPGSAPPGPALRTALPGGAAGRGARSARRMRSSGRRTPNGRHRAPRSPQRRAGGLTEAQGLEVALGVGERCTVTRAIEERRRSHPSGRRGPYSMAGGEEEEGGGSGGGAAPAAGGSSSTRADGRSPTEARWGRAGRAQ